MIVLDCKKSVKLALQIVNIEYSENPSTELLLERKKLEDRIDMYLDNCKQMNEIENRLYYKIAYEGKNVMKACNEVADENYFKNIKPNNIEHIRRIYHNNVKKYINVGEK